MSELLWSEVQGELARAEWDRELFSLEDPTMDQSYEWGEYQRRQGWAVRRFAARDTDRKVRAMAQVLCRSYGPWLRMLWVPGGPAGDVSGWGAGLRRAVRRALPGPGHYVRFFSHRPVRDEDRAKLEELGWGRVRTKLRSGFSVRLNLEPTLKELEKGMSRNWKKNLHLAGENPITVRLWERPDVAEIRAVYRSMEELKGLPEQFSPKQLANIIDCLGERLVLYRCDDISGRAVALHGFIALHDRAWNVLLAASAEGRDLHASYALAWKVAEHLKAAGVREVDLRGVDPERGPGVYQYKRGIGAKLVEYLGEWDWASNSLMRRAADYAVRRARRNDPEAAG